MAQEKKKPAQGQPINMGSPKQKAEFPLQKINFILIGVCLLLIIVGFLLMSGSPNTGDTWNADIFSSRRTVVGPTVAFLGFVLMIPAIIIRKKK